MAVPGQKTPSNMEELLEGLWKQNPVFVMVLGMCPVLAVSVSAVNALSMGLATTFVLVGSTLLVSLLRNVIPKEVRIATYILIIATFVTVVDYLIQAISLAVYDALGAFIQLIVVNCIILGRAEAHASKNPPLRTVLNAVGMGAGFTIALCILAGVREIVATGRWFDIQVMPKGFVPWLALQMPVGAFITLGLILGLINVMTARKEA